MHLENRVGIIFLQLLFLEGHSNCESGDIFTDVGRSTNGQWCAYIDTIHDIINKKILGTDNNPSQWYFPLNKKKDNIGQLRIDNNRTRILVQNINMLIDVTVCNSNCKTLWKRCVEQIIRALEILSNP